LLADRAVKVGRGPAQRNQPRPLTVAACLPARNEAAALTWPGLIRHVLERFYPELADIDQPLAGECAVRRGAVAGVTLADGYGIEIGLLIDLYLRHGRGAIAQAHLGERMHRNRPLHDLKHHSRAVIDAVLARAHGPDCGVPEVQPAIRTPGR
jgi:glucosyl-3-phosphoglycerate synthase